MTRVSIGDILPEDVSAVQLIRELQPQAKFLLTLSDPVRRMYSDYYFLNDNLLPVYNTAASDYTKSAQEFHLRSKTMAFDSSSTSRYYSYHSLLSLVSHVLLHSLLVESQSDCDLTS